MADRARRSNLGSAVAETARAHPHRPALWAKGEILDFQQLYDRSAALAHALRASGICPGDRVAFLSERSAAAYIAILGILFAGAAYVPLSTRFPRERNRRIIESSGAKAVVHSDGQAAACAQLVKVSREPKLVAVDANPAPAEGPLPCDREAGPLAYVLFTSGTTGAPKGVPISHDNVFAYLRGIRTLTEVAPEDRILQIVDLTFDLSVHDIFLAWTSGACLFSVPENGTLLCSRFVQEHAATHWLAVPSAAALIRQTGLLARGCMPSLKYSFFCGEALTGAVAEFWAEAAPNSQVINLYGPTEATVAFSAYRYIPRQAHPPPVVSLGEPFPEQRMRLFDSDGRTIDTDVGEICLSGSQLTDGYWNAPKITAQRFFEADGRRWYRTGDLGRYVPGEGISYLGRVDRQVKLRGFRVELQEIENAVRQATGSELVAVVPWPVDASGSALGCVAFAVEAVPDGALERCREILPDYMVPSQIISIDALPLNSNGKVDHLALARRLPRGDGAAHRAA